MNQGSIKSQIWDVAEDHQLGALISFNGDRKQISVHPDAQFAFDRADRRVWIVRPRPKSKVAWMMEITTSNVLINPMVGESSGEYQVDVYVSLYQWVRGEHPRAETTR